MQVIHLVAARPEKKSFSWSNAKAVCSLYHCGPSAAMEGRWEHTWKYLLRVRNGIESTSSPWCQFVR